MKNKFSEGLILKIIGALLLAAVAAIVLVKFAPQIVELARDPQKFAGYLNSFGYLGFAVFIFFEVLQVVIAVIPGDLFHFSAGFIYGMPLGFILAYFGELLGAVIAFGLARSFGADIVKKFVREERIQKTGRLINSAKGTFGILLICLVPAIPKDVLVYVAGLTPVKPSRFLTVFLLSRIPDIFIKASGGSVLYYHNYTGFIIIMAALLLLVGVGYILKNKFIKE